MKKRLFVLTALFALVALVGVGLFARTAHTPSAHATAAPVAVVHMSGPSASADLVAQDGDVTTEVNLNVVDLRSQTPPGRPTAGRVMDYLLVSEFNSATGELYFNAAGSLTPAPGFQIDSTGLTAAHLSPMTVSVQPVDEFGNPTLPAFDITLEVNWTGVGPIVDELSTSHVLIPHELNFTAHFSGASRDAMATGAFSYISPRTNSLVDATTASTMFARLANSRLATITVQHAPFPG